MVLTISLGGVSFAASSRAGTGPLELQVTEPDNGRAVELKGEVLVVKLPSNPSTGYGWQAQGIDAQVLRQLDATEWLPDTEGKLGGPGTEVLRFAAVGRGQTTLNLVYARPWQAAAPAAAFSLQVRVAEPSRSAIYPEPAAEGPLPDAGGGVTALPSVYNWCDLGECTAVRDQGNCGSCWAFGTVGSFESAILIADNLTRDLSEQWLVSCNTDGWGCNGGWWAHDYHVSPGSVYETDFPYTATDAPCGGPYTYHEKLASWAFIGSENGVPATDAIKQAIYDHGPVSAAVCVNTAFQLYTGGVFSPTTRCNSINHAIVLTGWDDAKGAWRLRNSWGSDWGEGGYMWIAYGKSYVGYSANYVLYGDTPPPSPTPAAPTNLVAKAVSKTQINLTWTDNATNELGFHIERCTGSTCTNFATIADVGANVTAYSNSGLTAKTTYRYRVHAYNAEGDSAYSNIAKATTLKR